MYQSKSYTIIINLEFNELLQRYIPEPYIVQLEADGTLGRMKARATSVTVPTYAIALPQDQIDGILHRANTLSLAELENKYCTKKRNQNTLIKLFQINDIKSVILKFYDRKIHEFCLVLKDWNIPMIIGVERKARLEDLKINHAAHSAEPILRFEKTNLGIKYSLKINDGKIPWSPFRKDVHILSNDNSWIVADYTLMHVKTINGNKLKPFLKNDNIFIKNEMVYTYFEKFILNVAQKTEIEAEGFDVVQYDEIENCRLSTTYDFVNEELVLDIHFDYHQSSFLYSSQAKNKTRINVTDDKKISIIQVKRHPKKEEEWIQHLLQMGLELNLSKRFKIPQEDDSYKMIQFIIQNKAELKSKGFKIDRPTIDGHTISLDKQSIHLKSNSESDWFDIHGVVEIGSDRIPFAQLLESIKDGNRFYKLPDGRYFVIPQTWMTKYEEIAKFGEQQGGKVRIRKSQYTFIDDLEEFEGVVRKDIIIDADIDYSPSIHLNASLRPYQLEGVKWLIAHQQNSLGACLADDMGLGKTLQTIAVLSYTKDRLKRDIKSSPQQMTLFGASMIEEINPLRALIILPSSLVFNWFKEIKKFNSTLHTARFVGAQRKKLNDTLDKFDIVLTTYHTVLRDVELLKSIQWEYIVLDESQMIKNKESKMFKCINELDSKHKISLSGTPIENSLSDLWSQMEFINPKMLGDFAFFKTNYLIPIEKYRDEDALSQLAKMVKPFILRRTKEEVAKDLPPLVETVEYINLQQAQKDVYDKVKSATRNYLLGLDNADRTYKFHVFAALTKLRQISNNPIMVDESYDGGSEKMDYILTKMETVFKSGHKVLVFSSFTKLIKLYTEQCVANNWSYVTLTGSHSQRQRETAVADFQSKKEVQFFFISLKAGGVGLNLTAADYVFILDPWWNPFAEKQAIARAHRIGQDKSVNVIRFIAKGTIEEKILALQERKKIISDDVINFKEERINLDRLDLEFVLN
ncbi:MAG: SNF2-related protein [Saprospiraceae bacterium]|nr:SNF2-related protein [Saprospiraceae bacterium]